MINRIFSVLILLFLKLKFQDKILLGKSIKLDSIPRIVLKSNSKLIISDNVIIRKSVDLRAMEESKIVIGINSVIDNGVRIIAANKNIVKIGDSSKIGFYSVLNGGGGITIGNNCSIYGFVYLQSSFHVDKGKKNISKNKKFDHGHVSIGDNCIIGAHSSLMPGTIVGSDQTVSFNSLITKK